MNKKINAIMSEAALNTIKRLPENIGAPFGAAIVKGDKVITYSINTMLKDFDPTAHAEVNAIRQACKILKTLDLSGYDLIATSNPCQICIASIYWSRIDNVYYSLDDQDARKMGFEDQFIIDITKHMRDKGTLIQIDNAECKKLMNAWIKKPNISVQNT